MAGLQFQATTAEVGLTAATAKTVLQVVAPSNHRVKVLGWSVSFDGNNPSAEPVVVRLLRQTTAGTMTALTPTKTDNSLSESIQSTAQHTATAEPTAGDVLARREVHPQGSYEIWYPLGAEKWIGGGGRVGIECTAPAGVNAVAELVCEE